MQRIDDDMDNLFTEAAENYSLKTPRGDWENIAAKLHNNAARLAPIPTRRRYHFLLLFLLFFVPALGIFLLVQKQRATAKKSFPVSKPFVAKDVDMQRAKLQPETGGGIASQLATAKLPSQTGRVKLKASPLHSSASGQRATAYRTNAALDSKAKNDSKAFSSDFTTVFPLTIKATKTTSPAKANKAHQLINEEADEKLIANQSNLRASDEVTASSKTEALNKLKSDSPISKNAEVTQIKSPRKANGKYIGVVAGIEWNEVKSQGMEKPGVNVGFATGYRFGKRLGFETGILLSRKNYYSNGKYFNPKPDTSAPAMEVLSLAGSATVLCIPLELRYNFMDAGKTQLYLSGGLNSYLLFFEKNHYSLMVSGTPQSMVRSYKEVKFYPLAALNIAMGMEYNAGQRLKLRVEPELQIPFRGIGIGRMPMTSFGINIGLLTRLP